MDEHALAVTADLLEEERVVNAVVGAVPIAWIADDVTGFPRVVDRRTAAGVVLLSAVEGRNPAARVRDTLTDRPVDPRALATLRVDRAYWFAWRRSHPGSRALSR